MNGRFFKIALKSAFFSLFLESLEIDVRVQKKWVLRTGMVEATQISKNREKPTNIFTF